MTVVSNSSSKAPGIIGRILGTLFFSVFLAAGLFFFAFLAREIAGSLRPWFWTRTDCVILESKLREGAGDTDGKWFAEISYRYRDPQTGLSRTSSQVTRAAMGGTGGSDDAGEAHRLVRRFPEDSRATCYAQGGRGEAVLVRQAPWVVLALLFPLIFVAIGAGGIIGMWRLAPKRVSPKALSARPLTSRAHLLGRGFFLLFFVIGAAVGYGFFVRPALKILQAKSWPAVPCTVVRSGVKTSRDSDGDTHRVDIHYRYEIAGERFDANRYSFFGGSSSGYQGKRVIADRYRDGSRATCFVNPGDPTDSVLERGFVGELWFGLIPGVFCAVGLLGFVFVGRTPRSSSATTGLPLAPVALATDTGSVTLQPRSSPVGKFVAIFIFAAIWNGMVAAMFLVMRDVPWFFKAIFGLAGLGLASAAFYQFLALFSPRPILTVNRHLLPLGGELRLDWAFHGNARRIRRLHIFLRGTEEATYRRGTDTTTDKHTFTEIELFNDTDAAAFASGEARVTVPADSMHTFDAPNNKIVWSLHVKGDIPRWPDVDEEFPITVLPLQHSSA